MSRGKIQLILFTRLPREGRTKTRLIPALGAAGAARFHDRLARHTVRRAEAFRVVMPQVEIVIRLEGGTIQEGEAWLGNYHFREQGEGDLGARLEQAVSDSFAEGVEKVIVIGTDCPELDVDTLIDAVHILEKKSVVFGPAFDGGYYLVGLTKPCAQIFQNIAWGGADVLAQSLTAAASADRSVGLLRALPDVDVPDDLPAALLALELKIDEIEK
jgi:uncharacterized protein